jgi:hypothetical protein
MWLCRLDHTVQGYIAGRAEVENESKSRIVLLIVPRADRSCDPAPRLISGALNLGPVANEVVIDAGELDGFGVIAPKPLRKRLYCRVEVEDHAACMGIPDHAL